MPTYNYNCLNVDCTKRKVPLEIVHKMTDPKPSCEYCGEQLSTLHLTAPLVQYKGDNWFCKGKGY